MKRNIFEKDEKMTDKPNTKLTGMFVLTALFVLIGTFLMINKDNLVSHTLKYVMYFDGSVKGLSVGAPVVLNGVPVGRVSNISLLTDVKNLSFKIPVTIEINANSFQDKQMNAGDSPWRIEYYTRKSQIELFHELIQKGLRGRLITQSILTGQMMIELSFYPDTPIILRGGKDGEMEIPTLPSSLMEFSKTLQNLPIHKIAVNFLDVLEELRSLLKTFNETLPVTAKNVSDITQNVNSLTSPDSQTVSDLNRLLNESAAAARSLHDWADYLERHPEALLKGKGGYR